MKELIELRKPREKHFLNDDGTFTVYAYNTNVHCLRNGKYVDIDNTIVEKDNYFMNKINDFSSIFAKANTDNFLLKIGKDDNEIKFDLLEKSINQEIKNNTINYKNILKNIDIKYEIINDKVKDYIILKNINNDFAGLIYKIETKLNLRLENNGKISVSNDNEVIFTIDKPTLVDKNNKNYEIKYKLEKKNEIYLLSFVINPNIIFNEELYPLIIDPSIEVNDKSSVYDTYIYPGDTNVDRNNTDVLKVGVDENNVVYRTLLKFDLPIIGTASNIIDAQVYLKSHSDSYVYISDNEHEFIDVFEINKTWDENTANWDNMHDNYNKRVEDYFYGNHTVEIYKDGFKYELNNSVFNITNLVKRWYAGELNNGILLKYHKEIYNPECKEYWFYSKNNSGVIINDELSNPQPFLVISYRNQNGLEQYMTYQNIHLKNGDSYINNLTGNITNIFKLNKTKNKQFPINLLLCYNTNDVLYSNDYGYGLGQKLNYFQTIKEVNFDNICLEFLDADGTIHYFIKDTNTNKIYDEDGLGLEAIKENDTYVLKGTNGDKASFIKNGDIYYLSKITNIDDESIEIHYDSQNRIVQILDNNNEKITLEYIENQIIIESNYLKTYINFSNNKVISIENKFGVTKFEYNENHLISKIIDIDGLSKKYDYYNSIPYRLKKVSELSLNDEIGNFLEFIYEFNVTRVKDNNGQINSYTFNDFGNTVCITNLDQNGEFRNSYGVTREYFNDFNGENHSINNKLALATDVTKYTKNYLYDSSFEKGSYLESNLTNEYAHSGKYSYKANGIFKLNLPNVKEGSYTFSGYFKNNQAMTLGIYYNESSTNEEIAVIEMEILPNNDFNRYEIPIDISSNIEEKEYFVKATSSDYIYIDDLQFEEGNTANYYNLIENSDFDDEMKSWTFDASDLNGDQVKNAGEIVTISKSQNAFCMHSAPGTSMSLAQYIPMSGKANETYRLSFWYKNEGIRDSVAENSNMALLRFTYPDNDEGHCIIPYILNLHATEWQFCECIFVTEYEYEDFYLNFISQDNANDLYITNITLTKDLENYSYTYDDNGNMISIHNKNNSNIFLNYNKDNKLVNMFDPVGNTFKFEYDKANFKILQALSKRGIANQIKYDEFDNPIETIVKNCDSRVIDKKTFYIRLRSSELYILPNYNGLMPVLKYPTCSNESWDFEKIEDSDYYVIKSSVIPLYLKSGDSVEPFRLSKDSGDAFELIENDNGSYTFKVSEANACLTVEGNYFITKKYDANDANQQFYLEPYNANKYIKTSAQYTEDGKFLTKTIDSLGKETIYDVDPISGLISSTTDSKKITTNYTYNDKEQLIQVEKCGKVINYEYQNDLLSRISCGNKDYNFVYDDFLNVKELKINDQIIIENEYKNNNGNLLKTKYGNGSEEIFEYDEMNRMKKLVKNNKTYNYYYNNFNSLSKVESTNEIYNYFYDFAGRISKYIFNDGQIQYDYNLKNDVINKKIYYDNILYTYNYEYDDDSSIIQLKFDNNTINYDYDELGRLVKTNINNQFPIEYEYCSNGNKTSVTLKSMKIGEDLYQYIYDELYNIKYIYKNNELLNYYEYNDFNELIRDDNYVQKKTFLYFYDDYGNLLKKQEYLLNSSETLIKEDVYEYSNAKSDQLIKYNSIEIKYDSIGNPLSIGDISLTWNERELQNYKNSQYDIKYTYDKDGIRISKNVNGIETKYFTENSKILIEQKDNNMIYYIYDTTNNLIGFVYNDSQYFYKKSYTNDIIGILDSNFELIATYEYDSYGKILAIKDGLGNLIHDENHIANINPFRYKGYYYDNETQLYYLNSRYYNPEWGRFINVDGILIQNNKSLIGNNLYAYCLNNPISLLDNTGFFSFSSLAKAFWNVVSTVLDFVGMKTSGKMLKDSLQKNTVVDYSNNSLVVNQIKKDSAFKKVVSDVVENVPENACISYAGSLEFTTTDLAGSLHKAKIYLQSDDNKNIHVEITDTYDFIFAKNYYDLNDVSSFIKQIVFTTGNNLAYIDQSLIGTIHNYDIYISFDYNIDE